MFSQTIIIAYGGVMPNWPRQPVQERSVGTSGDPTEAACLQRVGRRIRHYTAQIARVASSASARSCKSEFPCLSSAGPPLLQRSALCPPNAPEQHGDGGGARSLSAAFSGQRSAFSRALPDALGRPAPPATPAALRTRKARTEARSEIAGAERPSPYRQLPRIRVPCGDCRLEPA